MSSLDRVPGRRLLLSFSKHDSNTRGVTAQLFSYRLIADTQAAASGAVNASRAYENIVLMIIEADNASMTALESAVEAGSIVCSENSRVNARCTNTSRF